MGGLIRQHRYPDIHRADTERNDNDIFIWKGGHWTLDLGAQLDARHFGRFAKDIVEIPSGAVIYNNNFMIGL